MSAWVRGDWMQTFTGRQFYPLSPRPDDVDPVDIAHALGMLCRYNGHVKSFYSVAEHCVLMSYAVAPENALWALLHDAAEAYVGDVIRPLKRYLPDYVKIENNLMVAILERFSVPREDIFSVAPPAEVKAADNRILLTERDALMVPSGISWAVDELDPLPVLIRGWGPILAGARYLTRLEELTS